MMRMRPPPKDRGASEVNTERRGWRGSSHSPPRPSTGAPSLEAAVVRSGSLLIDDVTRKGPGDPFARRYQFGFGAGTIAT